MNKLRIKLSELSIQMDPILGLMGYANGDVPPMIIEIIESELLKAKDATVIEGGYVLKDAIVDSNKYTLDIEGVVFNPGKDICELYSGIEKAAVFACTAGEYMPDRSKQLMNEGLMLEGYVVDVLGSVIVEKGMDKVHDIIREYAKQQGKKITNRYSPGYWKWNVEEQKKIFSILPENFCGISINESSLMSPVKSVSGLIGIGSMVIFKKYNCNLCSQDKCIFKKNGNIRGCSYSNAV